MTRPEDVEIVWFQPAVERTAPLFRALAHAAPSAGFRAHRTMAYRGDAPWLVFWGPGAPERARVMRDHVKAGGRAVAWDLGYWQRDTKMRVSIDAAHPTSWVMRRDWPATRAAADQVVVRRDAWCPTGPILFAGIGPKARVQYGADVVDRWEREMAESCQARWPGRPILYRAKKAGTPMPAWASSVRVGVSPIEQALRGVSLVVTWHSNVAVDAVRAGVPVVCREGAAAAVCPSTLPDEPQPLDRDVARQFLANLAWFQWAPWEAAEHWRWLREATS